MKKIFAIYFILFSVYISHAQDFSKPIDYLNYINDKSYQITQALWNYMKTAAHSRKDKKIQRQKQQLIETILEAKRDVAKMPPLNGKTDLRDSLVSYFDFAIKTLKGDLTKLEEMQLVSQQSYSAMLRYLKKQEEINDKLSQKGDMVSAIFNIVAQRNNITVTHTETELGKKIKLANFVNSYHNKLFIIYFRNLLALNKIIEAINNNDRNSFYAWKDSLNVALKWADKKIIKIGPYNKDISLKKACKTSLNNFKTILSTYLPKIEQFYNAEDELKKQQTIVNSKPKEHLTQQEINAYNNAVKKYNEAVNIFNETMKKINSLMQKTVDQWNKASHRFLDKNVPK